MIEVINKKIKELDKLFKKRPNFEFYDCEMEGIGEDLEKYLKTFAISILEKQNEELEKYPHSGNSEIKELNRETIKQLKQ